MAKSEQYKLKDPQTTFYDPETKFKVVGDKPSAIDPKKGKGKLTSQAVIAGGLIKVGTSPSGSGGADDGSDLPEDFPSREDLIAGGVDSLSKVKAASDKDLEDLKGIGKKAVERIRAATE